MPGGPGMKYGDTIITSRSAERSISSVLSSAVPLGAAAAPAALTGSSALTCTGAN